MKIVCPNKSDPAWKKLVAQIGEPRAFLAFFRNGNFIPDVATAWKLLSPKNGAVESVADAPSPFELLQVAIVLCQLHNEDPKSSPPRKYFEDYQKYFDRTNITRKELGISVFWVKSGGVVEEV
jgi:hypothetical protein